MRPPCENTRQRNRWRLLAVTIGIAPMLAAVVILAAYFCERSPAPLEPRLRKPVHDLRADVPVYHAWIIRMFSTGKAAWMPARLVKRAYAEAERLSEQRGRAASDLVVMRTNAWAAIPALLKALQSRNVEIRYTAAVVLGRIKADQAPEFARLIPCLRNQERPADVLGMLLTGRDAFTQRWGQDVRCLALKVLAAMGPGARSQLGMMLEILRAKEEDNGIRVKASEVILAKVSLSALFASLRLNGPLERNRRPRKNFAPFGLRVSTFFRPSTFGLRISGSAGLLDESGAPIGLPARLGGGVRLRPAHLHP